MSQDIEDEIVNRIKEQLRYIDVDCPECESIGDDQYQCCTCGYGGGNGKIDVIDYIIIKKP